MRRIAIVVALALAACDGGDSIIPIDQIVRYVPSPLDFGDTPVEERKDLATRLESTGGERLQVRDVRFDPPGQTFFARKSDNTTIRGTYLGAGSPIDITVGFIPGEARAYEASMVAVFDEGEAKLPLLGAGVAVEPARPQLSPSSVLFQPAVELGRRIALPVMVTNAGGRRDNLVVGSVTAPFSFEGEEGELAPGESRVMMIAFQPTIAGPASASIEVAFERGESATLEVRGEGAPAGMISCTPESIDFGEIERGMTAGRDVTCTVSGGVFTVQEITLDAPRFSLSGAPPPGSRVDQLALTVNFNAEGPVGTDRATLSIVSASGTVLPIEVTGRLIAPAPMGTDLKVRLEWDNFNTDFDLHLTRNGEMPFDYPNDCYFEHSHLDWDISGDLDDDPFLDRDDQEGYGPEEINLGRATGPYDVYVHYFGTSAFTAPSTGLTLTYWLRGQQATQQRTMSTCGNMWFVGRIDFRGGTPAFTVVGTEVDTWSGRALRCPPP
jgi:hypothetical protein